MRMRSTLGALLGVLLALGAGCGDSLPGAVDSGLAGDGPVVEPAEAGPETAADASVADVRAPDLTEPAPSVTTVVDKGGDGSAVVGEEVTLTGQEFRSDCKVLFGTVSAKVLSVSQLDLRFQTPEGIPVGTHSVQLSCGNGTATFSLTVIRYHLVTVPDMDRVAVLEEKQPGQIVDSKLRLQISDPDGVALSDDSAVAYVASARSKVSSPGVSIVDLTTAGGPSVLSTKVPYSEPVKMPVYGVAAADDAPLLAVAGGLYVLLYDITDPRNPQKKGAVQFIQVNPGTGIPQVDTGYFIDTALTPDGKTLLLLDGASDQLHIYDVSNPASPKVKLPKMTVSAGTSSRPVVSLPVISGILGALKVKGGSAQDVTVSTDGSEALVLAGGGVGALLPETFNLDLANTTISVVDLSTGAYINRLEYLRDAHFPNNAHYGAAGRAYVSSLSASTAVLVKVIFQVAVMALVGGGSLDLMDIAKLLVTNFFDVIDVIKAAFNGTLFHLGGLHRVVSGKASTGSFLHVPYIQAGMCTTYDQKQLLSAGQGWVVDIQFDFPKLSKFVFRYDLGVTIHDLTQSKSYQYLSLFAWKAQVLLPPWSFGHAGCQQ